MALGVCRSSLLSVSYVSLVLGTYNYTDILILFVRVTKCIHTYKPTRTPQTSLLRVYMCLYVSICVYTANIPVAWRWVSLLSFVRHI